MTKKKVFSLIEISIAIAIFSIVSVYLTRILYQGYHYTRSFRMKTIACLLAQEKIEELSTDSDPSLFSNPDSFDEGRAQVDSEYPDFDREVDVTCPYLGNNNLARIIVTVYWQGEKGERSVSLRTLIADF